MAARIESVGDLWTDLPRRKRSLRRPIARVQQMLAS
jgi:hypothetical protein